MDMEQFDKILENYRLNIAELSSLMEGYKLVTDEAEKISIKTKILCQISIVRLCEDRLSNEVSETIGSFSRMLIKEEKVNKLKERA